MWPIGVQEAFLILTATGPCVIVAVRSATTSIVNTCANLAILTVTLATIFPRTALAVPLHIHWFMVLCVDVARTAIKSLMQIVPYLVWSAQPKYMDALIAPQRPIAYLA